MTSLAVGADADTDLRAAAHGHGDKLGARAISFADVRELPWNGPIVIRNPGADGADRRLLLGRTNGGRYLTLVIEATHDADGAALLECPPCTPRTCVIGGAKSSRDSNA